jgi:hypothetical protein
MRAEHVIGGATRIVVNRSTVAGWIIQTGYEGIGGVSFATFDVEALDPPPIGTGHRQVGGFIQHTEVTADGISTRIIQRWPDEIGKVIAP